MSEQHPSSIPELPALKALREIFLGNQPASGDYWRDRKLLEAYDQFFGQRIAWKWESVLKLGWQRGLRFNDIEQVVDIGCGTGVASEALLHFAEDQTFPSWQLIDRSEKATQFARQKIKRLASQGADVKVGRAAQVTPTSLVLVSHVLSELDDAQFAALLTTVESAQTVIWVEGGTRALSERLTRARQALLQEGFHLLAPCSHDDTCPMLGESPHWCHHFAPVPSFVFQSAVWAAFSKEFQIDLHKLPVSFLIATRDESKRQRLANTTVAAPRIHKGFLEQLICDSTGAHQVKISKSKSPVLFRALKKQVPFCDSIDT